MLSVMDPFVQYPIDDAGQWFYAIDLNDKSLAGYVKYERIIMIAALGEYRKVA